MNIKRWGEHYNPSQPYALGHECPNCEWSPRFPDTYSKFAVGFDPSSAPPSKRKNTCGAMIIECPECFTKYWFHTDAGMLERAKQIYPEKFRDLKIEPENRDGKRK